MRAFAPKQNQLQKAATSNAARTQMSQTNDEEVGAVAAETASSRFEHDFSRVPVHHPAPAGVQTKLAINQPGDEYEKEAEHLSDQVMRMSEPSLQRACAGVAASPKGRSEQSRGRLQTRRVEGGGKEQIAVPPIVQEVLATSGQPLDAATRGFMEKRFGHDFSRVRVHADAKAAASADIMNARAYTVGHDMVFGTGQYVPGVSEGNRLLAHELTHTVQQGQAATTIQRALKFELQTENYVWAVKDTGAP